MGRMKEEMVFVCIKSKWDDPQSGNIIMMKGDRLMFLGRDDKVANSYDFEVIDGWAKGMEVSFTNKEVCEHLEYETVPK
jgi:hypothetical protein